MSEPARSRSSDENANAWKRAAVTAAGGTLLLMGLRRRTLPGYAVAAAGGWLAYRGIRGEEGRDVELVSLEALEASAQAVDVERTLTIQAPVDDVRSFLSDTENLDQALGEAGSVEAIDDARQHWALDSPTGHKLVWEMQREELEDEDVIRWSATSERDLDVTIRLDPAPGDRGTEATLSLRFHPPGGSIGKALFDRLETVPHVLVGHMLRRMKGLIETGEAPALTGNLPARDRPSTSER